MPRKWSHYSDLLVVVEGFGEAKRHSQRRRLEVALELLCMRLEVVVEVSLAAQRLPSCETRGRCECGCVIAEDQVGGDMFC